jgi:hypothetical protein
MRVFWPGGKHMQNNFQDCQEFAKQILAIPASSSSSERLFSLAGLFDTVRRGALKLETLEVLTLLKANKQLILDYKIDIDNYEDEEMETDTSDDDATQESSVEESEDDTEDDIDIISESDSDGGGDSPSKALE